MLATTLGLARDETCRVTERINSVLKATSPQHTVERIMFIMMNAIRKRETSSRCACWTRRARAASHTDRWPRLVVIAYY